MKKKYRRGVRQKSGAPNKKQYRRGVRKKNWFARMALWKKILLAVCLLLLIVLGLGVWYVYTKWEKIDTHQIKADDIVINKEVQENMNVDLGDGYTNVALFGVDTREGNLGEGSRTDCIIVASLNNKTKEIKMISVYRDTFLDLSEGTYQKCNAAYSFGGPTMAINMLNMNLDLNIQEYITVDFGAISDVIDLLGGLEIDVTEEEAMYMNEHIAGTGEEAGKEVHYMERGGRQLLDGVQATTYARIRSTAGGDFTRAERQRHVIELILDKVKKTDIGTINKIVDQVFPQISTSFTLPEILSYAKAYKEYAIAGSEGFPYQDLLSMDSIPEVGSVVVPNDLTQNVSRMHEFLFGTKGYTPSSTVNTLSSNIMLRTGGVIDNTYNSDVYGQDTTIYDNQEWNNQTDYNNYNDSNYNNYSTENNYNTNEQQTIDTAPAVDNGGGEMVETPAANDEENGTADNQSGVTEDAGTVME